MLDADHLRARLDYDPATGVFQWKNGPRAGRIAGTPDGSGYRQIGINGRLHRTHRLAFLWMAGRWPRDRIDHIDGDRTNDQWLNLREATTIQNAQNLKRSHRDSRTQLLGVSANRTGWRARIRVDGRDIHLGTFRTQSMAHSVYLEAKRALHRGATL